jgi:hypothetical protein
VLPGEELDARVAESLDIAARFHVVIDTFRNKP